MQRGLDISDMFRSPLSNTQRTQSPNAQQIDYKSHKLMKLTKNRTNLWKWQAKVSFNCNCRFLSCMIRLFVINDSFGEALSSITCIILESNSHIMHIQWWARMISWIFVPSQKWINYLCCIITMHEMWLRFWVINISTALNNDSDYSVSSRRLTSVLFIYECFI